MTDHLERALLLLEQRRYELAEEEVRKELGRSPESARGHALLALCLAERDRLDEATEMAVRAVGFGPDLALPYYALASVLKDRRRFPEAEQAILESIRLSSTDPQAFAILAEIRYEERRWRDALAAAEEGLALDAEDALCANLRALSLLALGRRQEADRAIDSALSVDPENALTHASRGWALLATSDPAGALEHFRESLRLRPELDWARQGVVEALKARNPVYGVVLRYFLWMARLRPGVQWLVVIGALLAFRLVSGAARSVPLLAPWLWPLVGLYLAFVLLTWIGDPLFNLLLRLSTYGRLALSREQVVAANWVGAVLFAAVASTGLWFATRSHTALFAAIGFGVLLVPVCGTFQCDEGWPRRVMIAWTGILTGLGATALGLVAASDARPPTVALVLGSIFLLGSILSSWLANGLAMVTPRR